MGPRWVFCRQQHLSKNKTKSYLQKLQFVIVKLYLWEKNGKKIMVQNFEHQHLHSRKKKQKQKQNKTKQNKTKQKTYYTLFIMYIDFPRKCNPLIIHTSISARFRVFYFILFCFFHEIFVHFCNFFFCSVFLFLYLALFWFEYGQIKFKKKTKRLKTPTKT